MDSYSGSVPRKFVPFYSGMTEKERMPNFQSTVSVRSQDVTPTQEKNPSTSQIVAPLIQKSPSADDPGISFLDQLQSSTDEDPGEYIEKFLTSTPIPSPSGTPASPKKKKRKSKRKPWNPRKPKKPQLDTGKPPDGVQPNASLTRPVSSGTGKKRRCVIYSDSDEEGNKTKVAKDSQEPLPQASILPAKISVSGCEEPPILIPDSTETIVSTTDVGEVDAAGEKDEQLVSQSRMMSAVDGLNVEKTLELAVERGRTDDESEEYHRQASQRSGGLHIPTRTLLREYFSSSPVITLPTGHATVAFTEGQLGALLQASSEEAAAVNFRTMKDILLRASNFRPLVDHKPKASDKFRKTKSHSETDSSSTQDDDTLSLSGAKLLTSRQRRAKCVTDTSSGENSDRDNQESRRVIKFSKRSKPVMRPADNSSGDDATLASYQSSSRLEQAPSSSPRRRLDPGRPGKVLKEECFRGQEWTRVFATGPMDPEHNKFRFYCQICKYNVSMYSKGKGELKRHYRRETHLRKDQKWRYENLVDVDPITKVSTPLVRDKFGNLLKGSALQAELPHFIDEELVDIGPKFPFYEDFIMGLNPSQTSVESKASLQLSVFGHFLRGSGNLSFLRSFWHCVGTLVNHQSAFSDIDWSLDSLSVSFICFYNYLI